jgi:hypothetical protein
MAAVEREDAANVLSEINAKRAADRAAGRPRRPLTDRERAAIRAVYPKPEPARPKAPVVEFPAPVMERGRQEMIAEQDRQRREAYARLCDATWQANLDRWGEEQRARSGGFHKGYGDDDNVA